MPVKVIITAGNRADCKEALALIDGFSANYLLADRGYDSNEILDAVSFMGTKFVIHPKRNRIESREYDKEIYKARGLVENAFLHLQ